MSNNTNDLQYFTTDFRRGTVEDVRSVTTTSTTALSLSTHMNEKNNNSNSNSNSNSKALFSSSINNSPFSHDLDFSFIRDNHKPKSMQSGHESIPEQTSQQGQGQGQEHEHEHKQDQGSSPKGAATIVAWQDGIDRFSNFVTKNKITHLQLYSVVETILQGFQVNQQVRCDNHNHNDVPTKNDTENSTFSWLSPLSSKDTFTYTPFDNLFLCRIGSDDADQITEFTVTIYTYQDDKCLLDIQKLAGEHFAFTHFFEKLKTALRDQDIIDTPVIKKEILSIYGLDMDIGLDIFI